MLWLFLAGDGYSPISLKIFWMNYSQLLTLISRQLTFSIILLTTELRVSIEFMWWMVDIITEKAERGREVSGVFEPLVEFDLDDLAADLGGIGWDRLQLEI